MRSFLLVPSSERAEGEGKSNGNQAPALGLIGAKFCEAPIMEPNLTRKITILVEKEAEMIC
jgi:hypothetical protein